LASNDSSGDKGSKPPTDDKGSKPPTDDKGSKPPTDDKGSKPNKSPEANSPPSFRMIKSLTSFVKDGRIIIASAVIGVIVLVALTSYFEYVPSNWRTTQFSGENLTVFVTHPSSLLLPVRNMFFEETYDLNATIYRDPSYKIDSVRLSTPSDSILTYQEFIDTSTSENPLTYHLPLSAMHSGEIRNITTPHNINIVYHQIRDNTAINENTETGVLQQFIGPNAQVEALSNNTSLKTFSISLGLPVRMMNFGNLVYLFIVFIGVFVSRYMQKFYTNKLLEVGTNKVPEMNKDDLIWLFASGIITLLIFSSFQEQVELQSSLITNISLAFTFGFGFDKLIETATVLARKKS
jgi:hypothetical protein